MTTEPQLSSTDSRDRPSNLVVPCANLALQIYTLEEAAAILRVKRSWLERQAAARKIPFTMLGGTYHFTAAHLTAIVEIHESAVTASHETTARNARRARPAIRRPSDIQATRPLRPRPRPDPRSAA